MKYAGWAIAFALSALILSGLLGDDSAKVERLEAARDSAVALALEAEGRRSADSAAHAALIDSIGAQRRAEMDSARNAVEVARVARAAAEGRTERLRATLTADQRAELDRITAFWQQVAAEKDRAIASLERAVMLADAEIAAERAFRERETDRADRWKGAAEASDALLREVRKADISLFGLRIDLACTVGPQAGYDALDRDLAIGAGVTCGANL